MIGNIIFALVGVVIMVAAIVVLYFARRTRQKSALMAATQTSSAAEAAHMAPGTLVEVKGTLRCSQPLTAEMSGETCAYYTSAVLREYMERDRHDDRPGSNRRTETISQYDQFAPFEVEDESGTIAVDAEDAEFDARQVVNRFERYTGGEGPAISFRGTTLQLGGGERTIGYRYTESILPIDAPVYVLGVVREDGKLAAPAEDSGEGHRFVVSHRSEEALTKSLGRNVLILSLIAAGLFVFGAIFVLVGIFVPMS